MKQPKPIRSAGAKRRPGLQVYRPESESLIESESITESPNACGTVARWLINGFPATIQIWTDAEWARLSDPPPNAQRLENGVWCSLQME